MQETRVRSLGWEDPLEEEMSTHSSILAWEIPWTEEPGRLQSLGLQKIGHNLATTHAYRVWSILAWFNRLAFPFFQWAPLHKCFSSTSLNVIPLRGLQNPSEGGREDLWGWRRQWGPLFPSFSCLSTGQFTESKEWWTCVGGHGWALLHYRYETNGKGI